MEQKKFEEALHHFSGDYTLPGIAEQIIQLNVKTLKKQKALTPNTIHDLRVATRRLRAALKTFKKILPTRATKISRELQKVARILGTKRDLDLFAAEIRFPQLAQHRQAAQKKIHSTLASKSYARLLESLSTLKAAPSKKNSFKVARNQIRARLKRLLAISVDQNTDDQTLHKLRIAAKKLRYVCEFFEPLFYSLDSLTAKAKQIQDVLGEHQDAITGISLLARYKSQFSVEEFIHLEKRYELKKEKTRKLFFKIWRGK